MNKLIVFTFLLLPALAAGSTQNIPDRESTVSSQHTSKQNKSTLTSDQSLWVGTFIIGSGYVQHTPDQVITSGKGLTQQSDMSITISASDLIWPDLRVNHHGLHIATCMDPTTFKKELESAGLEIIKSKLSFPVACNNTLYLSLVAGIAKDQLKELTAPTQK